MGQWIHVDLPTAIHDQQDPKMRILLQCLHYTGGEVLAKLPTATNQHIAMLLNNLHPITGLESGSTRTPKLGRRQKSPGAKKWEHGTDHQARDGDLQQCFRIWFAFLMMLVGQSEAIIKYCANQSRPTYLYFLLGLCIFHVICYWDVHGT